MGIRSTRHVALAEHTFLAFSVIFNAKLQAYTYKKKSGVKRQKVRAFHREGHQGSGGRRRGGGEEGGEGEDRAMGTGSKRGGDPPGALATETPVGEVLR